MAWIESHDTLGAHPKTRKLARLLGISRVQAVGHLQFFWWWAMSYAPDGELARFDHLDLATGAEWEDEPAAFVEAMTEAGFIDRGDQTIHDWDQYGGKLLRRKSANADRMRDARASHAPDGPDARSPHIPPRAEHVPHTCETRAAPEKSREENRREDEKVPSEPAPQAAAAPVEPDRQNKPRTAKQQESDRLFERRQECVYAYFRGLEIAPESLAAKQRATASYKALTPALLATPECAPEIIEPLTRYAAAAFAWRDGKQTPSLAEVLGAFPEWDKAGRPQKPVPKTPTPIRSNGTARAAPPLMERGRVPSADEQLAQLRSLSNHARTESTR